METSNQLSTVSAGISKLISDFTTRYILSLGLVILGTLAPGSPRAEEETPRFELLHLWGSDGETRALAAYSSAAIERGVEWDEHIVFFNYLGVRAMFAKRLSLSVPPSGLFWIGGESGKQLIDAGLFRGVPTQFGDIDFSKLLVPEFYEVLHHRDMIAILPVGGHIQNRIFYNSEILNEIGREPPKSWGEFLELAPEVAQAGYHAIVMSDQRWQNRYVLLSILAEKLSMTEMRRFLDRTDPVETYSDQLRASVELLAGLRKYSNADFGDLSWDAAISKVYDKAGFAYVLGDFTGALIPKDDGTVICETPPGNEYLMWAIDGIALVQSEDPAVINGQDILIEVVADRENHRRYLSVKGGITAYLDGDGSGLDACARASRDAWNSGMEKLFIASEEWTETLDSFATLTSTLWRSPGMTAEEAFKQLMQALEAPEGLTGLRE